MPPKRKRVEDADPSTSTSTTRATRSSTRQTIKATAAATSTKSQSAKKSAVLDDSEDATPAPPKRTRKSTGKNAATSKKSNAKTKAPELLNDDVSQELTGGSDKIDKSTPKALVKTEPYSPVRVQTLFDTYADKDDPQIIGAENFGQLCADANIPMEGAMPLILFWNLGAKEFGNITREEWTEGMKLLMISSLPALRIFLVEVNDLLITSLPTKAAKKDSGKEPYDRTQYFAYAKDRQGTFKKLYMSCFLLIKTGQSRNIEMETAVAFWSVLLAPQYPIMNKVITFINDKGSYKAVNKDVWSMMLEFCRTVDPNLENYEADGAWPTLLDDFVSWNKGQAGNKENERKDEDGE